MTMVISTPTNPFDNETSTRDTIQLMTEIAIDQAKSPIIQGVVRDLQLSNLSPEDQCYTIYSFVRRTLTFKEDEIQLQQDSQNPSSELLRTPEYLLTVQPEGDCDDYSLLAATLLLGGTNLGVAFATIKARDDRPLDWSHVYCMAIGPNGPVGMDCSHGPYVGWEMPDKFVSIRKYWRVRSLEDGIVEGEGKGGKGMAGYTVSATKLDNVIAYDGSGLQDWQANRGMGLSGIQNSEMNFADNLGLSGLSGPPIGGGDPTSWTSIIQNAVSSGVSTLTNILGARYAVPPTGTVITSPSGSIVRTTDAQSGGIITPMFGAGGLSSNTLLLAGAAIVAVMLLKGRR